jgi:hypothetical protein
MGMGMGMVWFLALYALSGYYVGLDIGLLVAVGIWGLWVVGSGMLGEGHEKDTNSKVPQKSCSNA